MQKTKKIYNTKQIDTQLDKIKKYLSRESLPLDQLIPDKKGKVIFMSTDICHFRKIGHSKAVKLYREGKAIVHSENTIYHTAGKRNTWVRRKAIDRDNHICHYCEERGDTVDHVIPISKGGKDSLENLVCCCHRCNRLKGTMSYQFFIKTIKKVGQANLERYLKELKKPKKPKKEKPVRYNKHGIPLYERVWSLKNYK